MVKDTRGFYLPELLGVMKLLLVEEHEGRGVDTRLSDWEGDVPALLGPVGVGRCRGRMTSRAIYFSVYLLQAEVGPPSHRFSSSVLVQEHKDLILGKAITVSFCHCIVASPLPWLTNQP